LIDVPKTSSDLSYQFVAQTSAYKTLPTLLSASFPLAAYFMPVLLFLSG
jgi:hypothetical protein